MSRFNFGPNDTNVQRWGEFVGYSLGHLDVSELVYTFGSESFTVYVTYSHHTFTKTVAGYNDYDALLFPHKTDPRHFHLERYRLSLQLPRIIEQLPDSFTFHGGRKDHYCACKLIDDDGMDIDYLVVFTVFRSAKKYRLHINSAYREKPGKTKKVRFEKILKALRSGRKLPGP